MTGPRKKLFHAGYADALHYRSAATHETGAYIEGWNLGVTHRKNGKRLKGYETVLCRPSGVVKMITAAESNSLTAQVRDIAQKGKK